MANCMYCQAAIADGSTFCSACGKKQTLIYQQTFVRDRMDQDTFIANINAWFAQYPQVANVKATIHLGDGFGFLTNKYRLDAVSIEYELFSGENTNQYGFVALKKFGFIKNSTDALLAEWLQANPGATVVARNGGVHQRGDTGALMLGGIGANNLTELFVLFKFNRQYGTGMLPPAT